MTHDYCERATSFLLAGVLLSILAAGCRNEAAAPNSRSALRTIKLATTTSTDNSGLLAELLPPFQAMYGIEVQVVAVGTGRAIKHGENGDVDVILVHARAAEDRFVESGFGVNRRDVMHNDFVVLGPAEDPARTKGSADVAEALRRLAATESFFVSRGDDSGTHKKEMALWEAAGVQPGGDWYLPAGQGMGAVLTIANEKRAYVLTDRGTYLAYRDKLALEVLVEGDRRLHNPYGVIAVNPARHSDARYIDAMTFIGWVTSPEGQAIIREFRRGGEVLFSPDAVVGAGAGAG